jgi:hypothetical protein
MIPLEVLKQSQTELKGAVSNPLQRETTNDQEFISER